MSTLPLQATPMDWGVDFGLELTSPRCREGPYPLLHRMRREDPVHYSRTLGAWLVTRYDDVVQAFRDPRLGATGPGS